MRRKPRGAAPPLSITLTQGELINGLHDGLTMWARAGNLLHPATRCELVAAIRRAQRRALDNAAEPTRAPVAAGAEDGPADQLRMWWQDQI